MQRSAWDDGQWAGLPSLDGPIAADLCVVGLGGSGLAAVAAALECGLSVVGIDAGEVAGGAAGRNGGFLLAGMARFHHEVVRQLGRELAARLYRETLLELERLRVQTPEQVRITGSLRIADSDEELDDCEAQRLAMCADGLEAERYEGPEGRGLLFPADGVCNPLARARTLARQLAARGARLFEHTRAERFSEGLVHTAAGAIEARDVIVAIDGRLEDVFDELRGRVRTARLQMLATEPTHELALHRPVYARWGYDYWQQLPDGTIVLGGARDRAMEQEWTSDTAPSERIQRSIDVLLRERLRVRARVTHRWAASVGFTPHGMPIVAEMRPHLWAIGGYNGTGNIVGALCARAIVEHIHRGPSERLQLLQRAELAAAAHTSSNTAGENDEHT